MEKITLNAMTKQDLESILAKWKPIRKCCKCGRDIPTDDDIRGISVKGGQVMVICNKDECVRFTWDKAMESPDA